jgi:CheY-like chemotaxis protein
MSRILIVEDDPNIVSFLTTILLGAGYICLAASSTQRARALLETESDIALLLLDQNLTEADHDDNGLSFLKELRSHPRFSRMPVIICSGDSRTAVVNGFLGQRISGFVKKPFRPERLLADVQRVLQPHPASFSGAPTIIH